MLKFIKKLFSSKKGKRTVVILNDDGTEELTSYKFSPRSLWVFCVSIVVGIVVLVVFLMIFTPVGGFVYNKQQIRQSVIAMQQQVEELQDSMKARNMQLKNLRQLLFTGNDSVTTSTQPVTNSSSADDNQQVNDQPALVKEFELSDGALVTSNLLQKPVSFPTRWPVEGTLTRTYNADGEHVGIDIAAEEGAKFHAIADGVVVGKNWTLNYGYVLYIQHQGGMVIIYKHVSEIIAQIGDLVFQGEPLGYVGNTGIISSGPHLHMEIWVNGIAQNPLQYLIKA